MPEMLFSTTINRPIRTVFQLITDLEHYDTWLPPSDLYAKIINVSHGPPGVGTTYLDKGPTRTMQGEITEFSSPTHVKFHQHTRLRGMGLEGKVDIQIQYLLESLQQGTQVTRTATIALQGSIKLLQPVLMRAIRKENERILDALKTHLEAEK